MRHKSFKILPPVTVLSDTVSVSIVMFETLPIHRSLLSLSIDLSDQQLEFNDSCLVFLEFLRVSWAFNNRISFSDKNCLVDIIWNYFP